jgi:hypothetical protein
MLGLYYRIWVDCITRGRSQKGNRDNWPLGTMTFMSMSMTFNFVLIMVILQQYILGYYFWTIHFDFLPNLLSNVLSFVILFVLPCVTMNYLLIFRNKRYEVLVKKYPYYNGKLFISYFLTSLLLPIILLWMGIIISRI